MNRKAKSTKNAEQAALTKRKRKHPEGEEESKSDSQGFDVEGSPYNWTTAELSQFYCSNSNLARFIKTWRLNGRLFLELLTDNNLDLLVPSSRQVFQNEVRDAVFQLKLAAADTPASVHPIDTAPLGHTLPVIATFDAKNISRAIRTGGCVHVECFMDPAEVAKHVPRSKCLASDDIITGRVRMKNATNLHPIIESVTTRVQAIANSLFGERTDIDLIVCKLLETENGKGRQTWHLDTTEQDIVVILHVTAGKPTQFLDLQAVGEKFDWNQTGILPDGNWYLPGPYDAALTNHVHMAQSGAASVFSGNRFHRAPFNRSGYLRRVIFCLYRKRTSQRRLKPFVENYQAQPWALAQTQYGDDSTEFLQSLVHHQLAGLMPFVHYDEDTVTLLTRDLHQLSLNALRK